LKTGQAPDVQLSAGLVPFVSFNRSNREQLYTFGTQKRRTSASRADRGRRRGWRDLTIFIIAFTGRSAFGDGVRQLLIVLSVIAGSLGAVAGMWVLLRAIQFQASRVPRLALGSFMTFIGIYTVVHVL